MIYALEDSFQDGMRLARVASTGADGQRTRSFSDRSISVIRGMSSEIATYDATAAYREMLELANAGRVTFYTINGAAGSHLMEAGISGGEAATLSTGAAGFEAVATASERRALCASA